METSHFGYLQPLPAATSSPPYAIMENPRSVVAMSE